MASRTRTPSVRERHDERYPETAISVMLLVFLESSVLHCPLCFGVNDSSAAQERAALLPSPFSEESFTSSCFVSLSLLLSSKHNNSRIKETHYSTVYKYKHTEREREGRYVGTLNSSSHTLLEHSAIAQNPARDREGVVQNPARDRDELLKIQQETEKELLKIQQQKEKELLKSQQETEKELFKIQQERERERAMAGSAW